MTLELKSCGFDLGNGAAKISLDEKVASVISGYAKEMPLGELNNKSMLLSSPKAFGLEIDNENLYFGRDILSGQMVKYIDKRKYTKPQYLMLLFKAALYQWSKQPTTDINLLQENRLNIVAGIPPAAYQDRSYRLMVEKAYKGIFDHNKPNYIKPVGRPAIPFFTSFGGVKPETLSLYLALRKLKTGYTIVIDMGYGTFDYALFNSEKIDPEATKTVKNGLLHAYGEMNPTNSYSSELDTLRGIAIPAMYLNKIELKIFEVLRVVQNFNQPIHLDLIGGGVKLLSADTIKDFKSEVASLWLGDSYTNARCFEKLGE